MLYLKETELGAGGSEETFSHVAEYCHMWSCGQGWFQFNPEDKLPGGKKIANRDGSNSLKPKSRKSLFYERPLKAFDSKR